MSWGDIDIRTHSGELSGTTCAHGGTTLPHHERHKTEKAPSLDEGCLKGVGLSVLERCGLKRAFLRRA